MIRSHRQPQLFLPTRELNAESKHGGFVVSPDEEITLIAHMPGMMGPQLISKGKRSLLLEVAGQDAKRCRWDVEPRKQ